jgi:hypothetical protein
VIKMLLFYFLVFWFGILTGILFTYCYFAICVREVREKEYINNLDDKSFRKYIQYKRGV